MARLFWEIKDSRTLVDFELNIQMEKNQFHNYFLHTFFLFFFFANRDAKNAATKKTFIISTWIMYEMHVTLRYMSLNFNENQFLFENIHFENRKCGNNYGKLTPFTFCEVVGAVQSVSRDVP